MYTHCDYLLQGTVAKMWPMMFDFAWKCRVGQGLQQETTGRQMKVAEANMKG